MAQQSQPALLGRERHLEQIQVALGRAVSRNELHTLIIDGAVGTGKTALAERAAATVASATTTICRCRFTPGGSSGNLRELSDLLTPLVHYLLQSRGPEQFRRARQDLFQLLGNNLKLLSDLVADAEPLADGCHRPPALPVRESNARLIHTLSLFLDYLLLERSVVLLLDDVHWADDTGLSMLIDLINAKSYRGLLVCLTVANDDDDPAVVNRLVTDLQCDCTRLSVENLRYEEVCSWLETDAETRQQSVFSSVDDIWKLTHGNPLFIQRLLADDSGIHVTVDGNSGETVWSWGESLQNLVAGNSSLQRLSVDQLQRLDPDTRHVLAVAACCGNRVPLNLLLRLPITPATLHHCVDTAVRAGLLIRSGDSALPGVADRRHSEELRFLHDDTRIAALALLGQAERQHICLSLSEHLLDSNTSFNLDALPLIELGLLNAASELVDSSPRRLNLVRLNLHAATASAKISASKDALHYAMQCIALSDDTLWRHDHAMLMEAHLLAAELCIGLADTEQALEIIERVRPHAGSVLDATRLAKLELALRLAESDYEGAIRIGAGALALWGVQLPDEPIAQAFEDELRTAEKKCSLEALREITAAAPRISEARLSAIMSIMINLLPATDTLSQYLNQWLSVRMINLMMTHGYVPECSKAIAAYAGIVTKRGDIERGYEIGRIAYDLSRQPSHAALQHRIEFTFTTYLLHWKHPMRDVLDATHSMKARALLFGDELYAGFIDGMTSTFARVFSDRSLSETRLHLQQTQVLCEKSDNEIGMSLTTSALMYIQNLTDTTSAVGDFDHPDVSESDHVRACESTGNTLSITFLRVLQGIAFYIHGDLRQAQLSTASALKSAEGLYTTIPSIMLPFFHSLVILGQARQGRGITPPIAGQLDELMRDVQRAVAVNPREYGHLLTLYLAERACVEGQTEAALPLYQQAIGEANRHGWPLIEAIAHERLADYWLARSDHFYHLLHLKEAAGIYREWGAAKKLSLMFSEFPTLHIELGDIASRHDDEDALLKEINLQAVIDATQAINQETSYDAMVGTLVALIVDYAVAHKACLLVGDGEKWRVEAFATNKECTLTGIDLESVGASGPLPVAAARYVIHTGRLLLLTQPAEDPAYADDPYISASRPSSILCLPVSIQGRMIGMFYIEYQDSEHRIPEHTINILRVLASQAATSIGHVQLHRQMEETIENRTNALLTDNKALAGQVATLTEDIEKLNCLREYLPAQVADIVVSPDQRHRLELHRQEVAIVFCDLRGFTEYSDSVEPEDATALLAEYNEAIGALIEKHAATIDHRAGDGMMMFIGDPLEVDNPAEEAVQLAISLRAAMARLLEKQKRRDLILGFGLGISFGYATIGRFGYGGSYGYHATGRQVNLASRLCDEARDNEILVSKSVLASVSHQLIDDQPREYHVKGFRGPIVAHNIRMADDPDASVRTRVTTD